MCDEGRRPRTGYLEVEGGREVNLDRSSAFGGEGPVAPPEWTMQVRRDGSLYVADISRAGEPMFKVCFDQADIAQDDVQQALAEEARIWINAYLRRCG